MRSIRYVRGTRKWKHGFRGYPKKYRKRKKFYMYTPAFDPQLLLRDVRINRYFVQNGLYPFDYASSLKVVRLKDILRGYAI